MKRILADKNLIAYCGLYCGACKRYLSEKCPGCGKNEKASWCKVRACCLENNYKSCADCEKHQTPSECRMFNNFISKLFGFIFRSDRAGSVLMIKESGYENYAEHMAKEKLHSIKRK